jgi:amidase
MAKSDFQIEEATIDQIHAAYAAGTLTVEELVSAYIERIDKIDKSGPTINSVISVNPNALKEAQALDEEYKRTKKFKGPLHGIPIAVKDQCETKDITTTFGSIAQKGYMPAEDATVITKLKAAGAIILSKTAMPDYATSWFAFCSAIGETKNPYVLERDPGGSSGGTAANISASLATVGIGEDTGGSIRLPACFTNLVGVKVTPGLISRKGMSPLVVFQDSPGPMARTVKDAAILLDAIAGYDPLDEYTVSAVIGNHKGSYVDDMDIDSLKKARLGIVRNLFGSDEDPTAAAVNRVMAKALDDLKKAGAELVDIEIPRVWERIGETSLYLTHSRHDINKFLASRPNMPVKSLEEVKQAKKFDPTLDLLVDIFEGPLHPEDDPDYFRKVAAREIFERDVMNIIAKNKLDGMIFPAVQVVTPNKSDVRAGKYKCLEFPANTLLAAQLWFPSISLPAGFTEHGIPVGFEVMVPPYREADLFRLGSAYEHATKHRRAPKFQQSAAV